MTNHMKRKLPVNISFSSVLSKHCPPPDIYFYHVPCGKKKARVRLIFTVTLSLELIMINRCIVSHRQGNRAWVILSNRKQERKREQKKEDLENEIEAGHIDTFSTTIV